MENFTYNNKKTNIHQENQRKFVIIEKNISRKRKKSNHKKADFL